MVYKLETVLDFGKYRGLTVQEAIDRDPQYMMWVKQYTNTEFTAEVDITLLNKIEEN